MLHHPRPGNEIGKGTVATLRTFLTKVGITPEEGKAATPLKIPDTKSSWFMTRKTRNVFGRVTGTSGRFTFIGNTPAEVKKEFRASFDDYLQLCIERGLKPDESFTGGKEAQGIADVHQAADAAAEPGGRTLNEWLGEPAEQAATPVN